MPGEVGLDHRGGPLDVALEVGLRDQHAGRGDDQVHVPVGEHAVDERLVAFGLGGVVGNGPHLAGEFLARGGEPLLIAPGQDDLGVRRQAEGSQDGQADLAGAADQDDPGLIPRFVRKKIH